jgi:phage-related protein
MSKGIRGITVEINGNTAPLDKALKSVNSTAKGLQSELKQVEKALKLDPNNITLTAQKSQLLKEEIAATKEKLDALKKAQAQVKAQFAAGTIDADQFRAFQRELETTKNKLSSLKDEKKSVSVIGTAFTSVKEKVQAVLDKLAPVTNGIKKVGEASAKLAVGGVKVVGTAVQGAGKALGLYTLAAGAAGTALAAFGIKGVKTASDLSEVENVVNKTFGEDGAAKVDVWAKQAAVSFGLSELSAKKMNGTMGAMLKSTGLTDAAVLDMSTSLTGLAGDMASFYNLDGEEAFNKLRSGISGETEPLKQLGINMSQANLAAFALAQGIKKPIASMSQAELATLRYNYILKATKDVQGDFAATSGGLANQLRIAKLQVENIASSFGQALLPSVTSTIQGLNGLINEAMPALTGTFTGLAEVMTGTEGASTKFSENLEDLISLISGKVKDVLPGIIHVLALSLPTLLTGFNTVLIALITSVGEALPELISALLPALLGGLTGLVTAIIPLIPVLLPVLMDAGIQLFMGLLDGLNLIIPQLIAVLPVLIQQLGDTIIANLPLIIRAGIQLLVSLIKGLKQTIPQLIPIVIDAVFLIMETLLDNIDLLLDAGIELILAVAMGLIKALPRLVEKIPVIIEKLVLAIMRNLPKIIDAGLQIIIALGGALITNIPVLVSKIPQILDALKNGFMNMLYRIKDIGANLISGLWSGIKDKFGWLTDKIKGFAGDVLGSIKKFFGIGSPSKETRRFGDFISQGLALGITDGARGVLGSVNQLTADAMSAFDNLDLTATAGLNWQESMSKNTDRTGSNEAAAPVANSTTINLNGNYSFRDRDDIDYFMNRMELAVRRV